MAPWRPLLAPAVMIAALLTGAYGLLVAPVNQRLAQVRADQAKLATDLGSTRSACARIDEVSAELRRTETEAAEVANRGRLAADRTGVFDAVTALAGAHGIHLGRVDPLEEPTSGREDAGVAPQARAAYSIEVRGSYGAVASFVRGLQHELGYALVRSVRLAPAEEGPAGDTGAVIVTEHLAFDASPVRAEPPTGGHGGSR